MGSYSILKGYKWYTKIESRQLNNNHNDYDYNFK